jgi:hypothetical protein
MPLSRITSPFQSATANVYSPSANTVAIRTSSSDRFTIDPSGRVSIGTTASNWGNGGTLEFTGAGLGSIHNTGTFANYSFSRNAVFNPTVSFWTYKASANSALYQQETETHNFYGAASGTAGNAISWSQLLSFERGKTLALEGATTKTGTGITFPATQVASSDPNTLDDYEEGTWTPIVTPTSGSLTSYVSNGYYVKVGRTVTITFGFTIVTTGTASGRADVAGLPFTTLVTSSFGGGNRAATMIVREDGATGDFYAGYAGGGGNALQITTLAGLGGINWGVGYAYVTSFTYQTNS